MAVYFFALTIVLYLTFTAHGAVKPAPRRITVAVSLDRDELELEGGHHQSPDNEPKESYYRQRRLEAWVKAETKAGR